MGVFWDNGDLTMFMYSFICAEEVEVQNCKFDEAGYDYQGKITVTVEGIECQAWASDEPHSHSYDEDSYFVDGSVAAAENFCRNPDNSESGGPWCYTVESGTRWDHCNIPICTTDGKLESVVWRSSVLLVISGADLEFGQQRQGGSDRFLY